MEVLAVDHLSGRLVMSPQSAGAETKYNEPFILWAGPMVIRKSIRKSDPRLSDFTDLPGTKAVTAADKEEPIPYPFRHEMERWREKNRAE